MDTFEFALQMEKDGEKYYRELMVISKTVGLRRIFAMLANEEIKHYKIFEQLRRQQEAPVPETSVLDNVKNVFREMKEEKQELFVDSSVETIAYRKACDLEKDSMNFYREKADQVEHGQLKTLFLQLAREEEKHLRIMEAIVEFVSRPEPGNWLENAEWHHLEDY